MEIVQGSIDLDAIEAHLALLEARAVALEALLEQGVATADQRAELDRVQQEAEFLFGALDDLGAFENQAVRTS